VVPSPSCTTSLVEAPTRQLVMTNEGFYHWVEREMSGALAPGVELVHLPLPTAMAAEVARVTGAAREEMSR